MHQGGPTDALCQPCSRCTAGVQNRMGGTFFALAFLGFTSLTTGGLIGRTAGYCRPASPRRLARPVCLQWVSPSLPSPPVPQL